MDELTAADIAYLIILAAEGRVLSNREMSERHDVRLVGREFARLNGAGCVDTEKKGGQYHHVITKRGRAAITEALGGGGRVEKRTGTEKVQWAALAVTYREPARPAGPDGLPERIRTVYADLAGSPGRWVPLTDLRARLGDAARADVDAALRALHGADGVHLEPQPFADRIGDADRRAAIRIGGEDRHQLAIGRP